MHFQKNVKKIRCYPLAVAHPCDGASAVRWRDPDLERWPRFASLRCLWAELQPGDVLRVPAYWMVHSELLPAAAAAAAVAPAAAAKEKEGGGGRGGGTGWDGAARPQGCATLVLRSPAARTRRDRGSLLLQAARQAELELSRACSPARTPRAMRDLLGAVRRGGRGATAAAGGALSSFPSPPASAAAASAEREAFAAALGDLRAASLGSACSLLSALEAAADPRRFTKTRWLEADGGTGRIFPPALPWTTTEAAGDDKNRPRLFLDSRTAEERKYPSLFRATIEAKAKERIPWISKKQQQLLLEQQRKKEEKEEQGEASLLLLEPAM